VTFIDFGDMTPAAREWCQQRGDLETLTVPVESFVTHKDTVHERYQENWIAPEGYNVWALRMEWFKKPFACLLSPYRRTVWIDVDCQVRRSISEMFDSCENPFGIAIRPQAQKLLQHNVEIGRILEDELEYNSGVFVFSHGAKIIEEWAKGCLERNNVLRGDQEVLSRLMYEKGVKLPPLSPKYNWPWGSEGQTDASIIHWYGGGKELIREQIKLLENMLMMDFSI
jgi:lipopolysaccharide biosynthesis glycosyltransferase